jgi:hypothetical protein
LNIRRLKGNNDWNIRSLKTFKISQRQEMQNVILDILILSKCEFVMGGVSNMFMTVLFFNPDSKFQLIPYLENHNGA